MVRLRFLSVLLILSIKSLSAVECEIATLWEISYYRIAVPCTKIIAGKKTRGEAGMAIYSVVNDYLEQSCIGVLDTLYVDPLAQGRGTGRAIYNRVMAQLYTMNDVQEVIFLAYPLGVINNEEYDVKLSSLESFYERLGAVKAPPSEVIDEVRRVGGGTQYKVDRATMGLAIGQVGAIENPLGCADIIAQLCRVKLVENVSRTRQSVAEVCYKVDALTGKITSSSLHALSAEAKTILVDHIAESIEASSLNVQRDLEAQRTFLELRPKFKFYERFK